jgi:acetylornithine deacetylase/succinyl-diaminopimelate desuccinylase-like protein
MAMAHVITAYEDEHARLQTVPAQTELGTCTVGVNMIQGGTGGNVIPAVCSIVVGQRTVPGVDAHEVYERLVEIAETASPLPVTCESLMPPRPDGKFGSDAFYQSAESGLIELLASESGTSPTVAPFGTNALRYTGFARELAVFGPGSIDDAHQATECVAIADLTRLANVFTTWLSPA